MLKVYLGLITAASLIFVNSSVAEKKDEKAKPVASKTTIQLINCGATEDYEDSQKRIWLKDQEYKEGQWGYVGGEPVTRTDVTIKNTIDSTIYLNERYSMTAYNIPVKNGSYTVKLHFAECYDGIWSAGQRTFTVKVEGKEVLKDLDVYAEAGDFTPLIKEIPVKITDKQLNIEFVAGVQNPMINGIEILQ